MDEDQRNQRRHERIPLHSRISIGPAGDIHWVEGHNISLRGLSFYTTQPVVVGSTIRIGIRDGSGAAFSLDGAVRHVTPVAGEAKWIVGAEFPEDLSEATFDLITKPGFDPPQL